MSTNEVPVSLLHTLFELRAQTGELFYKRRATEFFANTGWKQDRAAKIWNTRFAGKKVNSRDQHGYIKASINGVSFKAHRIVFAMAHNKWPMGEVDHINGVKDDNRPSNLRDVTHNENSKNQRLKNTNTTGGAGISTDRRTGLFVVSITSDGKKVHIGQYDEIQKAKIAREAAARALGYHRNHGRKLS